MENTKKFADSAQYIVISMGDEQFGIDIKYIDNIVKMQHITRVPNVASYIKGVINLRGEVIPVMSARLKMFLPADEITRSSRIIILKLEQHGTVGIIVDEVKEVVTLDADHIEKVSYDSANADGANFVTGIGKHDEQLISLLDLNLLLQEKENA